MLREIWLLFNFLLKRLQPSRNIKKTRLLRNVDVELHIYEINWTLLRFVSL